jgi:NAD(P)-dependent dehydrogenase (short-subunit alcohol dehydrogenase family)
LANQVILVSGAASGIGLAVAARCLAEGAAVALLDIERRALEQAHAQLDAAERTVAVVADVAAPPAVEAAVAEATRRLGPIDGFVHSAYWTRPAALLDTTPDDLERTWAVTIKGAYHITRRLLPAMRERGGVVVPIASVHAFVGFEGFFAYQVAKAALLGFVRSVAVDYGPTVRAVALCPGAVESPALHQAPPPVQRAVREGAPARRAAAVEEVAAAAAYLLSAEAAFMTGTALVLDGGWTAI